MSRLHRLEGEHLELALGLYHDRALIRHLISTVRPPAAIERVAINLGAPDLGPWLIVSRDGHFVTCLGVGMQLLPDQYVVERQRLDQISESVDALRELVAHAQAGGRVQTQRQLARIAEAGAGLSQQEFDALAQWLPLLSAELLESRAVFVARTHRLGELLRRRKKLRARDHELLHDYWRTSWALTHLTMLLASDGGATARNLCEQLADRQPQLPLELGWALARFGVSPFMLHGAWLASKLPGPTLSLAKRRYHAPTATRLSTLSDALSLVAIALRHRRYRAEVRKTLARSSALTLRPVLVPVHGLAASVAARPDNAIERSREHTLAQSRRFVAQVFADHPALPEGELDEWPAELCAAIFMGAPVDVQGEARALSALFDWLTWIVTIEARDFYVPEPLVEIWRGTWRPGDAMALLHAVRRGGDRALPRRAPPKPGRNAACPCGSGKKYKRCCGR